MRRILLVDDHPEFTAIEKELLNEFNLGYEIQMASDADYALELLEQEPFDVVILDLIMPRIDGLQLLAEIKRRYEDLPVIIYSAFTHLYSPETLKSEGAKFVVSKPSHIDDLIKCIESA